MPRMNEDHQNKRAVVDEGTNEGTQADADATAGVKIEAFQVWFR